MTDYTLRADLAAAPLFATSVMAASPVVVEAVSATPFAALCLDMEHSTLQANDVEDLIRAADVHAKPVIVRVPDIGSDIPRVLDAGAAGIIVPQVETAQQAREVVDRARYAPVGRRGLGPGRGSDYGASLSPAYTGEANDRTLVAVQIESGPGVRAAHEILATPGIDAVVIGPGDLSMSLGVPMGAPEFWAAVEHVFAVALDHGVAPGSFCFRDDHVSELVTRGTRLLLVGSDLGWVARGAATQWAELQSTLSPAVAR
ncbi:aldolase/citrate lyase family protein [Amycolatopsis rhabdoformis]|uniref:Aldolase/citrate lyase family protein n=1 Tax=Amycolatopsis rhabdoformis TaxID=1448059 RepID=A0ABZ1IFK3_9PSEU|nr:aldolase/citrate lyase family protein [Amycolatopsis rhabdoformis]WSE32483.1 aldolase/citrate lyase family protein [Amycolatopsis rhabdoformis]